MQQTVAKTRFPIWWWLVPVLLLGFALLVDDLINPSLWSDEGWTIAATDDTTPGEIVGDWVKPDVHPPLFFLGLRGWRIFTGDTIFEMRYFSVLISIVGVVLAFRLGKALFGSRAGLFAGLFYALHDLVNVFTHEVRHYPLQMALVTLAMWLYWRFFRRPTRKNGLAFALAGAALIYTHYWGGLILIGMGLHALITQWGRWTDFRRLLYGFLAIALLYLPWLPILYHQITVERPGGLPHALENSNWVYRVLLYQLVGIPEWFWLILAVVGAMGAYAAVPVRWKPSKASLLPLIVAVLAPGLSILLNTRYETLSFRALAVIVPVVIVLAAHGLAQFRPREQTVMVVFILAFGLTSTSAGPVERPPWPEIADYLATHSDASDVLLLENDTDEHTLVYYLQQTGADLPVAYTESTRELRPDDYPAYLAEALEGVNGIWVSQLEWPALNDIRPALTALGFVETAPERDDGMYNDRPILLWRLDRVPQDDPHATFTELSPDGDLVGELRLVNAETAQRPDGIVVTLLWSPSSTLTENYTVSVKLLNDGVVVDQTDSYPLDGQAWTSTWEADGLYFDSHLIPIETPVSGNYRVAVSVYRLTGETDPPFVNLTVDDCTDDPNCVFIIVD